MADALLVARALAPPARPVIDAAGYVRSVPLPPRRVDELHPGLWLGACALGAGMWADPRRYSLVITCCGDQPLAGWPRHLELAMTDGPTLPNREQLLETVAAVVEEVLSGGRVLTRCWAGLNRSGLVAVLALAELWQTDTATALDAARALRSRWVLCNGAFARYVLERRSAA